MEVARYAQSTQNRKLEIFLQRVLQLLLCSIVMQNIQIFYGGPVMFIFTCFLAQPDSRNFLTEHRNTIIKQRLCGEGLPSSLSLLQVDAFQEKQGILQQIILCSLNKRKKAFIRPCDTNNFTQSLTRKYHHTATESLYHLFGAKISWTPTLAGVSYQFGFVPFPIPLQCKICGSSVFSIFFSWSFTSWSKKSDGSQFLKISSDGLGLEGLKVPKVRVLEFWQKFYPFRYAFLFQHEVPMAFLYFLHCFFGKTTCLQKSGSWIIFQKLQNKSEFWIL